MMKLQNSTGSTTVAFIMHKTERDPRKVGAILYRILSDPKTAAAELRKQFIILGGNHSFAANLKCSEVRNGRDENFLGMVCQVFAFIDWWDDEEDCFIPEGKKQIDCVSYLRINCPVKLQPCYYY